MDRQRDADLVRRASSGDREAFEELLARHVRAVYAVSYALTRDPEESDDNVQETFLRAVRDIRGLRSPAKFGAWIVAIARNLACNRLRSSRGTAAPEDEPVAPGPAPDEAAAAEEETRIIRREILALPDGTREAILLHYYAEKSVREIADLLGVRPAAIAKRLEYGRHKLADRLIRLAGEAVEREKPEKDLRRSALAAIAAAGWDSAKGAVPVSSGAATLAWGGAAIAIAAGAIAIVVLSLRSGKRAEPAGDEAVSVAASPPASIPAAESSPAASEGGASTVEGGLDGLVVDEVGVAVPGAQVFSRSIRVEPNRMWDPAGDISTTSTDEHGAFRVEGPLQVPLAIAATARGFAPAIMRLEKEQAHPLRIVLLPEIVLRGIVTTMDGRPLEGARFWCLMRDVPPWEELFPLEMDFEVSTDGAGRFAWRAAWPGEYAFRVEASGYGGFERSLSLPCGEYLTFHLVMRPMVSGRAFEGADRVPIAASEFRALSPVGKMISEAPLKTGPDGSFSWACDAELGLDRKLSVVFQYKDYRYLRRTFDFSGQLWIEGEELVFAEKGITARGTVRDAGGRALSHGTMAWHREDGIAVDCGIERNGEFVVKGLEPGAYSVGLDESQMVGTHLADVIVTEEEEQRFDLVTSSRTSLTIRIIAPDGQPIPGARPMASYHNRRGSIVGAAYSAAIVEADERGICVIRDAPINSFLRLWLERDGACGQLQIDLASPPADPVLALKRHGRIQGVVRDAAGEPVGGAAIEIGMPGLSWRRDARTQTDADGRYGIDVPTGGPPPVLIASHGTLGASCVDLALAPGETRTFDLTLSSEGVIGGRVLDSSGSPIAGATVRAYWPEAQHRGVVTDEFGRFAVAGVPVEADAVAANQSGYLESRTEHVRAGTTGLEFVLLRPGTVKGKVFMGGRPCRGATVSVCVPGTDGRWQRNSEVKSYEEDSFVLPVRPGLIRIAASSDDFTVAWAGPFEVPEGGTVEGIVLEAAEGTDMTVLVAGAPPGSLEDKVASLVFLGDLEFSVLRPLDRTGRCVFQRVPPGTYRLELFPRGVGWIVTLRESFLWPQDPPEVRVSIPSE